jgi:hypothetical protein
LALLVAACDTSEVADTTTSIASTTSTTIVTTLPPSFTTTEQRTTAPSVEWERLEFDGTDGPVSGQVVMGQSGIWVLQRGAEFWSNGDQIDRDGDPRTMLWRSPDGMTWDSHVVDVAIDEGRRIGIVGEVEGRVLLAQSEERAGFEDQVSGVAVVLHMSDDLLSWTEVLVETWGYYPRSLHVVGDTVVMNPEVPGSVLLSDSSLSRFELLEAPWREYAHIVSTQDRFYALGYSLTTATIWSSFDGRSWDEMGVFVTPDGWVTPPVIAANDDTVLALVGRRSETEWWVATTGGPFTAVASPPSPRWGPEVFILSADEGFLVSAFHGAGTSADTDEVGPFSTLDGSEWRAVGHPPGGRLWWPSGTFGSVFLVDCLCSDGFWILGEFVSPQ